MIEGELRLAGIVMGLAEREMEMEEIVAREARSGQRRCHLRDVGRIEPDRLQIGEAPPGFAERGRQADGAAVGGDALVEPADRLEHMTVAHPDPGLVGQPVEHLPVEGDRLFEAADPAERRRLQILVRDVFGRLVEQEVEDPDGLGRPVLPVEHGGEIGAGRGEAGRELEGAAKQGLGIRIAAEPAGQLRHHPDRRDVGRLLLEVGAQQPLGVGEPALDQGQARLHQPGIANRCGQCLVDLGRRKRSHGPV